MAELVAEAAEDAADEPSWSASPASGAVANLVRAAGHRHRSDNVTKRRQIVRAVAVDVVLQVAARMRDDGIEAREIRRFVVVESARWIASRKSSSRVET
jgi:hypothetical protein